METTRFTVIVLILLVLFVSCQSKNDPQQIGCQPPATLIAKGPCESGYPGAQLVASNYSGGSATQFIYSIFVQKDTLSSDLAKSSYANASNEQIIISEAILKDAPKFVVLVSINCGTGKDYFSRYFSFVKRPTANPGCYVWALQNQ
ncbi:hypothetical protein EXU85_23355 [Spirosoma sp. KCTC 42546]|uniref:hypothetical protein n=1 Tax=Spirosoma sp. KCTC 42546 TaxID=2520506 RepID=UPI00115B6C79|nr:hypothetical protein [Spirosoma sp. KCTC 42546]QDK81386.1 hypothetical protein EXU85_23355 [Spirosoma sp. KCTC 42546]